MSTPTHSAEKWVVEPSTPTVQFFHRRIREVFKDRVEASGKPWEEAVFNLNSPMK